VDLKLCVSICHCAGMLWSLTVMCGEVPIKENTRILEQLCAFDTALDSQLLLLITVISKLIL